MMVSKDGARYIEVGIAKKAENSAPCANRENGLLAIVSDLLTTLISAG
jgi:hypothetical protein